MNRLQNAVLVVWVVILLLLVAFNWQMIWRPVTVVFLFQEFSMPVLLWLVLGGIATAGILRTLSKIEVYTSRRRADKELHTIKAKAFDGMTGEFEKMISQLQTQLGDRLQTMLGEKAAGKEGSGKDTGKDTGEDAVKAPPADKDDDDAPPQLSAETAATLAELKSGSGGEKKEEEAELKPKRSWRKKKS